MVEAAPFAFKVGLMTRIAITGGIAEGKSTVLGYLRELGFSTVSSDDFAREVLEDGAVQQTLAIMAGLSVPIDRALLRERLFREPELRKEANALTHPLILNRIRSSESEAIEIPLLIETCLQGEFDRVWVVTCGEDEQRNRLQNRLGDSSLVSAALASQLPTEAKIPFADLVVRTNREPADVQRFVAAAAARIQR